MYLIIVKFLLAVLLYKFSGLILFKETTITFLASNLEKDVTILTSNILLNT
jgi:hypothetical protein